MNSDYASKDRAVMFLEMCAAGQVREAYAEHVGPGFKHHNPWYKGDPESLLAGMAENHEQFPHTQFEVQRALQDGNLVAVHSRFRQSPDDRDLAVVHILRFEDGRIAEFWDIAQAAPDDIANENGMSRPHNGIAAVQRITPCLWFNSDAEEAMLMPVEPL